MHSFTELAFRSTSFALSVIRETEEKIVRQLDSSAETILVKNLQMLQLHRAVVAVGLFSLFDAWLQGRANSADGFSSASKFVSDNGHEKLACEFNHYRNAINVLKHGKGRSYDQLMTDFDQLPFRMKRPGESFFDEGDVSEVKTLIQVDDRFIDECSRIIEEVSKVLSK